MYAENPSTTWLDRPLTKENASFKIETLLAVLLIAITLLSRFAMLGERVMSHDEVNHVVPSWELFSGKGYAHNPVTHGPFQFHIVALSYFLFGDNDFTSRVPAAAFSTAAVIFVLFAFRRYLGRSGAFFAALFFAISPYMLFYGRYTRNEGFIELFGVVMLYAVLRHMDRGDLLSLFLLTGSVVFHFTSKETAFIYVAQLLVFLMVLFLVEVQRAEVQAPERFRRFLMLVFLAMVLVFGAIGYGYLTAKAAAPAGQAPAPAAQTASSDALRIFLEGGVILAALGLSAWGFTGLVRDLGWQKISKLRSFNLLVLSGTLVLPQLSAFPVKMVGWDPLDYSTAGMLHTSIFLVLFLVISAVVGILWNRRVWLMNAFFFYAVYIFLYTTMFTNGQGFFTGIIGSLGYWLSQQGVNRGGQPLYYFPLLQMPIYEFLAVAGTILAIYFALRHNRIAHLPGDSPASAEALPSNPEPALEAVEPNAENAEDEAPALAPTPGALLDLEKFYAGSRALPVMALLIFWAFTSLVAYSMAGEKMPWLTVHVTMGFLLAAGWGVGYLIDSTDWKSIANLNGAVALCLLPIFFTSAAGLSGSLLGTARPFAGNSLDNLQATSKFIFSLVCLAGSGAGILYLLRAWQGRQILRLFTVTFFGILIVLTARAAFRATFINYDNATEFLVYAHAASGPKQVLAQIEEISRRMTKGKDLEIAYSGDGLYPYWWYLRDYPNHRWFGDKPTRELKDVPVIIAGDDASSKMAPIVGDNYVKFEYMRLWWPMQGYYNLTWERIRGIFETPDMLSALWDIWLNRDYTAYAKITKDTSLTLENWQPSARMAVYIRKDVISQIWNYGAAPTISKEVTNDPYQAKLIQLNADQLIGQAGTDPGLFNAPRGLTVAPDGSVYVADSRNNRIQHLKADGTLIQTWGTFADVSAGQAPGGTFNEPWDVAVGKDGSVYVTDTWNHRIQQFNPDGQFIRMWGYFGQAEKPEGFWGPRALAIDAQGRVYVSDTGNKRIVVFTADGTFVTQFGTTGADAGQFDEPIGLAIDSDGLVYVADTWNQRIQVFQPANDGRDFTPLRQWTISGWNGQSLDNKPFLAYSKTSNHILAVDPEGYRILEFDLEGNFVRGWGGFGSGTEGFGIASGVALDGAGNVWASDGANNHLLHFTLPK